MKTEKGNVALVCLLIEGCFIGYFLRLAGKHRHWVFLAIEGYLKKEKEDNKAFPFSVYP
jgi:hypothetical protein